MEQYQHSPLTIFVHLDGDIDFFQPDYKHRVFHYLGGFGLVYKLDTQTGNHNYPLTHAEFFSLIFGDKK